jgi:hypothetical protein
VSGEVEGCCRSDCGSVGRNLGEGCEGADRREGDKEGREFCMMKWWNVEIVVEWLRREFVNVQVEVECAMV